MSRAVPLRRTLPGWTFPVLLLGACTGPEPSSLVCGEGTYELDGVCVAEEGETPLVPGHYSSPLVQLQRLQGEEDHMHIQEVRYRETDARLFYCSYGFGVINASDPQDMEYMAQDLQTETPSGSNRDPGCHRLDWSDDDPDIIFTAHRKNMDFATFLTAWDLQTNPEDDEEIDPVQITPALQEEGVSYEGLDYANGHLYVATHEDGLAIYDFDGSTFTRIGSSTELENAWDVVIHESGDLAVIADGLGGVATVDVSDPSAPRLLGRVATGGQAEVLVLDGDIAYVAAAGAGFVVVDLSNPSQPTLLATVDVPGIAVGIDHDGDKVYLAAWNDTRVYDVSTPSAPRLLAATRNTLEQSYDGDGGLRPDITARTLGVAGVGDTVFVGNWWVPYSYQLYPDRVAPYIELPETFANVGFGPVAAGESKTTEFEVSNGGNALLTLVDVWADSPAFTVEPAQALIPPGESLTLTVTYTATNGELESSLLSLYSDDPQTPVREVWLVGNQPGLGVGVPMPETTGDLVDGESWTYSERGAGKVTFIAYFATFCPVCSMEIPAVQAEFADVYGDELEIVALDPDDDDDVGGVKEWADHMGITLPIGVETGDNYDLFQDNYDGANPYPTDVVVDKNGIIRYVAVEYDPVHLVEIIDELLAE